jgi:hypothetical protein
LFATLIGLQQLFSNPLQTVVISKKKSDNLKALQKMAESDSFVTYNALHAQLCQVQD